MCQLCTEACPGDALIPSPDWAFGARSREDLVWQTDTARIVNIVLPRTGVDFDAAFIFGMSMLAHATAASRSSKR